MKMQPSLSIKERIRKHFGSQKPHQESLYKRVLKQSFDEQRLLEIKALLQYNSYEIPLVLKDFFTKENSPLFFNKKYKICERSIIRSGLGQDHSHSYFRLGRDKGLFLLPSVYFIFSEFYKIIDFSYNGLYFLPTRFYDESQIEVLLLRENNLRYIDSRISNLQNLQILDLRDNEKLAEIPKSLYQIKDLKIKISRNMMHLIRKTDPLEVYEIT